MIEKVLENWLNNASERGYQLPLCNALFNEGYTIIHSTHHNAMEMGKDLIVEDSDGNIVAYQLKSTKGKMLTLAKYREDVQGQLYDLAMGKVVHPAISKDKKVHKAFLVVNGDIHEHVQRSIDDFNRTQRESNSPEVGVIVKGQLLKMFSSLVPNFAPTDPNAAHHYLKLFLSDGRSLLSMADFSRLFQLCAPIEGVDTKSKVKEASASLAVFCASALSNYTERNNYLAEASAWVCYLNAIVRLCLQTKTDLHEVSNQIVVAKLMAFNALDLLIKEVMEREDYFEGDPLLDCLFTQTRTTQLSSVCSIYYFWCNEFQVEDIDKKKAFCANYCSENLSDLLMMSEGVIVSLFPVYFLIKKEGEKEKAKDLLITMSYMIIKNNQPSSEGGIPSPYYTITDLLPFIAGTATSPIDDSFEGDSYILESLIGLLAVDGHKEFLEQAWRWISEIAFLNCEVDHIGTFLWRSEAGKNVTNIPTPTQSYKSLVDDFSKKADKYCIPLLESDAGLACLFYMLMPHRFNATACSWLWKKLS